MASGSWHSESPSDTLPGQGTQQSTPAGDIATSACSSPDTCVHEAVILHVCTCISMWADFNMHVSFLCATNNGEEHAAYPAAH